MTDLDQRYPLDLDEAEEELRLLRGLMEQAQESKDNEDYEPMSDDDLDSVWAKLRKIIG